MSRIQFGHTYKDIISLENLLLAWKEFLKGKKSKKDVQEFQLRLTGNIFSLHQDLKNKTYQHEAYHAFNISDPKPRNIHKASVRDRLLHHAVYRIFYPFFDRVFIADSYSCRKWKGTHKAVNRFRTFVYKSSKNHTKTLWVLKCDIKKFFASIDHKILLDIVKKYVIDEDVLRLIEKIVRSFETSPGKGLPLGNLTSQLLVNIYMNEFDQFVKHRLKTKYYIRYADDFVIMHQDKGVIMEILGKVGDFLEESLKLSLHPDKIFIKTIVSGVDFLGWVHFFDHRILRRTTRRRMVKALASSPTPETVASYLGMMGHGNTYKIRRNMVDPISHKL